MESPRAFQDEAALHRPVHQNPHLLPLVASLRLLVLGSEAQLGNGYADILAVEPSGRPTIIEVKLASNREARRAVVSQVLVNAVQKLQKRCNVVPPQPDDDPLRLVGSSCGLVARLCRSSRTE